mmetsp:Transcript_2053/g.7441  ORF Transcript_2053/g.7441 Transcript_2053/m.7441 type:complete len:285 (+) Transcript_2053:80-934(+)
MSRKGAFQNELSRQQGQEVEVLRKVRNGFKAHKTRILQQLDDPATYDRSKKGGVDAPIIDLVQFLNTPGSPFVTSSSCSGRVAIFAGPPACELPGAVVTGAEAQPGRESADGGSGAAAAEVERNARTEGKNSGGSGDDVWLKGGEWLFVSHEPLGQEERQEVYAALERIESNENLASAMTTFKFEPFIVHVQCVSLSHARALLNCGLNAGFRNSGMVLGAKKLSVAIRSTMHLDVPIGLGGKLLVSREYVDMLIDMSNEKFRENVRRIDRLCAAVKALYCDEES